MFESNDHIMEHHKTIGVVFEMNASARQPLELAGTMVFPKLMIVCVYVYIIGG